MRRGIAAARPRTLVASAEDACTFEEDEVARLAAALDVLVDRPEPRVLFYTRHPLTYVASAVEENIRGNGLTLDRAKAIQIGGTRGRCRTIIARWNAVFGAAALTVRAYETAAAGPGGLIGDALEVIGVSPEGIREVRRNEAIADEIVHLLAERNACGAPPLAPADAERLIALKGAKADLLSEADRRLIAERAADDLALFAEWGIRYEAPPPREEDDALRTSAMRPPGGPRLRPRRAVARTRRRSRRAVRDRAPLASSGSAVLHGRAD